MRDPAPGQKIEDIAEYMQLRLHWADAFMLDQLVDPLLASDDPEIKVYGSQLQMRIKELRLALSALLKQHADDTGKMGRMIFDAETFKLHNFSMADRDALILRQWFDSLQDVESAQYWSADDYRIAIELYRISRMRVPEQLMMRFQNLLKTEGEDKL